MNVRAAEPVTTDSLGPVTDPTKGIDSVGGPSDLYKPASDLSVDT